MDKYYSCKKCGIIYYQQENSSEPNSCPSCGTLQDLSVAVESNICIHGWLQIVHKQVGSNKTIGEQIVGDELTHDTGKWSKKQRIIDRENNLYYEIIVDKETGEVIHFCEEPLDQHFGHGSDKK